MPIGIYIRFVLEEAYSSNMSNARLARLRTLVRTIIGPLATFSIQK